MNIRFLLRLMISNNHSNRKGRCDLLQTKDTCPAKKFWTDSNGIVFLRFHQNGRGTCCRKGLVFACTNFRKPLSQAFPHDSDSRHLSSISPLSSLTGRNPSSVFWSCYTEFNLISTLDRHVCQLFLVRVVQIQVVGYNWRKIFLQPSHGTLGTLELFFAIGDLNLRWLITVIIKSIWFHKMFFVLC